MKIYLPAIVILTGLFALYIRSEPPEIIVDGIEIVAINEIDRGFEVLARAWQNGEQIGFGRDGTVDIETFRFINPPEDLYEQDNLYDALHHTIRVKTQKHRSGHIQRGKVGNTTTTVYPDGGSTTEDGRIQRAESFATWASTRNNANGTNTNNDANPQTYCGRSSRDDLGFNIIERFGLTFPSPDIGTDTIDSATVSLYGTAKTNTDNDGQDYLVAVSFAPASNTAFVNGDYDAFGETDYSNQIDFGVLSTSGYNDFSLNATGIAALNKNDINPIGFREGHDLENAQPSTNGDNRLSCRSSEHTGTTQDPKMVIEHTAAGGGSFIPNFILL